MNEEIPILPILLGFAGVLYFGYEVNRQRSKLRKIFNVFEREESLVAGALEELVRTGQLQPYRPASNSTPGSA
jgi:hypothetical protein